MQILAFWDHFCHLPPQVLPHHWVWVPVTCHVRHCINSSEDWPGWSSGLCRGWWHRSARWRTQCTRRWGSTAPGWLCLVSTEITKIFGKINLTNHHCWVSHWQRCCISGQVEETPSLEEQSCKAELFMYVGGLLRFQSHFTIHQSLMVFALRRDVKINVEALYSINIT